MTKNDPHSVLAGVAVHSRLTGVCKGGSKFEMGVSRQALSLGLECISLGLSFLFFSENGPDPKAIHYGVCWLGMEPVPPKQTSS
jgi:hypothetical protein